MPTRRRKTLTRAFYRRPTLTVAENLLGKVLVHDAPAGRAAGMIVEVEAYIGEDDPACHAAAGRTERTAPLYGPGGQAYVYLNYGIHHLFNAVTEARDHPAAVLIRALGPVEGLRLMARRRARPGTPIAPVDLCRGPGNLSRALGIALDHNNHDLQGGPLTIEDWGLPVGSLRWGIRVGIRKGVDRPWRCWMDDHACVSGRT